MARTHLPVLLLLASRTAGHGGAATPIDHRPGAGVAATARALVAPNTSLATIPVAYFGGKGGKSGARHHPP